MQDRTARENRDFSTSRVELVANSTLQLPDPEGREYQPLRSRHCPDRRQYLFLGRPVGRCDRAGCGFPFGNSSGTPAACEAFGIIQDGVECRACVHKVRFERSWQRQCAPRISSRGGCTASTNTIAASLYGGVTGVHQLCKIWRVLRAVRPNPATNPGSLSSAPRPAPLPRPADAFVQRGRPNQKLCSIAILASASLAVSKVRACHWEIVVRASPGPSGSWPRFSTHPYGKIASSLQAICTPERAMSRRRA
jgi:hypothetical protein